ncbi:MAG: NRDE family protein [Bernardetiaceae bacterium]|nr:NRDE family protein [Bernardetiaceae bacterium]
MCLIAFQWKKHTQYKLILIANRDEFYNRPTQPAHFWASPPDLLAGKDLEAGGTWMGVSKKGKFAALTNYRDLENIKENAPSRGHLVLDYFRTSERATAYLSQIATKAEAYNGFNLLLLEADELYYFSNYQNQIQNLQPGLYGLSNHLLDSDWYKVRKAKQGLEAITQNPYFDKNELFKLFKDRSQPEDKQVQQTGLPLEKEKMLSSMCIVSPDYGTCSSSLLLIDYEDNMYYEERQHLKKQIASFVF